MKYVLSNSESVQYNFFIFDHTTFIQFKICCCLPNFIKIGRFFKMAAIRRLRIVLPPYETTHEVSVAVVAACQISYQSDTQIWRYSYLNFLHIWLEMPIQAPKMGVLGHFGPLNVIIHHRDPPKGTSLRKSASFKLSTVKICWAVWPVGELTESVTDTQTHRGKFIFCPCIA